MIELHNPKQELFKLICKPVATTTSAISVDILETAWIDKVDLKGSKQLSETEYEIIITKELAIEKFINPMVIKLPQGKEGE